MHAWQLRKVTVSKRWLAPALVAALLATAYLLVAPLVVLAAPAVQSGGESFDLVTILRGLSVGGAGVLAMALASLLYEKSAWFQKLDAWVRLTLTVGTSALIGLASFALLQLPPEALAAAQPWVNVFLLSVSPLIGGEIFHAVTKPKKESTVVAPNASQVVASADSVTITGASQPPAG